MTLLKSEYRLQELLLQPFEAELEVAWAGWGGLAGRKVVANQGKGRCQS